MKKIKNLLIHAPNWLGDIVMSLPAIHLIKEEYEDIKITVLAKKSMFGILTVSGLVDDVIELKTFPALKKYHFDAALLVDDVIELKTFPALKKYHFDAALLFPNSFESAFRVFGHGIKRRIGYKADYRSFMLTEAVERESVRWIHTADYYVNLLKAININKQRPTIKLNIKKDILNNAKDYIYKSGKQKNICLRYRCY